MGLLALASDQQIVPASASQHTLSHSATEGEFIACDTGTQIVTWLATVTRELCIPVVKQFSSLRIDKTPATKYHEAHIVVDTREKLLLLKDNKVMHARQAGKRKVFVFARRSSV